MTESNRGWILTAVKRVFFVFITLLGLSCSEEPTDQNSPNSPAPLPDVIIRDTTITAMNDSTFKRYIPMDGTRNLVGSAEGYTAMSVLQFYPNYFPLRDTVNILSARMRLRLSYRLGAQSDHFSFDVYRVVRSWSSSTITWDSVQTGFYDASTKRGTFSDNVSSDTGFIYVDLDTAMVRLWLSSTATSDTRYGIILVPTPSASVRGFVQYGGSDSATYFPQLTIIAAGTSGNNRDTSMYSQTFGTFVGDVALPHTSDVMNVQAGVVYRSKLLFDVSFIPRGTTINSAVLTLDVVPGSTRLTSATTDTNVAGHIGFSDDPSYIDPTGALLRPTSAAFVTMSGDISGAVQSWVKGPNYGLVLRNSSPAETATFDLYSFYGAHASTAAIRPRIKITYSLGIQ